MRTHIPNRTHKAAKQVGTVEWLLKMLMQSQPDPEMPEWMKKPAPEQQVYEPVGDRRKRMEANKADPERRQNGNMKKRSVKQAAAVKATIRRNASRKRELDVIYEFKPIGADIVPMFEQELRSEVAEAEFVAAVLATEPEAGKRRQQTLARKAKRQFAEVNGVRP